MPLGPYSCRISVEVSCLQPQKNPSPNLLECHSASFPLSHSWRGLLASSHPSSPWTRASFLQLGKFSDVHDARKPLVIPFTESPPFRKCKYKTNPYLSHSSSTMSCPLPPDISGVLQISQWGRITHLPTLGSRSLNFPQRLGRNPTPPPTRIPFPFPWEVCPTWNSTRAVSSLVLPILLLTLSQL